MSRFYLRSVNAITNKKDAWEEVSYKQYIEAEKRCGFHSAAQQRGGTATQSFSTDFLEGKRIDRDRDGQLMWE